MNQQDADKLSRHVRRASYLFLIVAVLISTTASFLIWRLGEAEPLYAILFWALAVIQGQRIMCWSFLALNQSIPLPRDARVFAATRVLILASILLGATLFLFPPSWLPDEVRFAALVAFIIWALFQEVKFRFQRRQD